MMEGRTVDKRRRDKAQLSCNLCKRRKQRCDRQLPCTPCSSRGLASSCTYPDTHLERKHRLQETGAGRKPVLPNTLQQRLNQLESLVQVISQTSETAEQKHLPASDRPQDCSRCSEQLSHQSKATDTPQSVRLDAGKLRVDDSRMVYVGSAHWSAVVDEISELRGLFQDASNNGGEATDDQSDGDTASTAYIPQLAPERPRLLFGSHDPAMSIYDVLEAIPDRDSVDRLILVYFNNLTLPHTFIHSGSFLRQYEKFWQNPVEAPPLWLATLFGIMSLASHVEVSKSQLAQGTQIPWDNIPPKTAAFRPNYLDQVVQCLVMGDYSKGGDYAIEALLHYLIMEHTRYSDVNIDTWLVMGIILRLAFRMGYHRDPSHFPSLSPLQQETRRRVWATLHAMDIMLSLQLCLPRTIKDELWDTRAPSNLLDSDLTEEAVLLPPPRPDYDATPMLHLAAKQTMLMVVGAIADASMRVSQRHQPVTISDEIRMATELRSAYDSVPEKCKFDTLLGCVADKPSDIVNRISITVLLQKGLIMLNWHHAMSMGKRPQSAADRGGGDADGALAGYNTCINAAKKVLEIQFIIETESQPGGILFPLWLQTSSIIKHEFLMSTVILCTHLPRIAFDSSPSVDGNTAATREAQEIEDALRRSHHIWARHKERSKEAMRVTTLLAALFDKLDYGSEELKTTDAMDMATPGMDILEEFGLVQHLQDINYYLAGIH